MWAITGSYASLIRFMYRQAYPRHGTNTIFIAGRHLQTWIIATHLPLSLAVMKTTNLIVTVSTPAGCSATDSALITVRPGNFDSLAPVPPFCPHDTFTLTPLGAGVAYEWYPSFYISDSLARNPVISPITTQSYSVIATSIYGCRDTLYFEAVVHSAAGNVYWYGLCNPVSGPDIPG